MKTEEIEKAANEYQERIYTDVYEEGSLAEQKLQCLNDFKAGVDFTNKYWQEKTRWIPVEEKLPDIRENEYPIYAKNEREKNDYAILVIDDQLSLEYLKKAFTHWKEIE